MNTKNQPKHKPTQLAKKASSETNKKKEGTAVNTDNQSLLNYAIPSAEWHETYVSRNIAGVADLDILASAHRMGHNVLLSGPTGSAKTTLTYAYASKVGLPVVSVPCNGAAEPSLFIGKWTRLKDGSHDFVLGELALAVQNGGLILLDEVNFLKSNIGAYIHGLLDGRRTLTIPEAQGSSAPTSIKAHDDCFIVGAYNPNYHGTKPLNQAFRNRFAIKMSFPYSEEVEAQLVGSESLLKLAQHLRIQVDAGNISTPVSTNLLIETEEFALDEELGIDFALNNFVSNFEEDEQQPVREVLVQYAPLIYSELFNGSYPADALFNPTK